MAESRRSEIVLVFAIGLGLYLCYVLRGALLQIYVSMIFAIIFSPIVARISRARIGRWSPGLGASILIFFLGILLAISAFFALVLPPIINDVQGMSKDFPRRLHELASRVQDLPFGSKLAPKLDLGSIENYLGSLLGNTFKVFKGLAGGITALVTVVILTAYSMLDGRRAFQWALSLVPPENRDRLAGALQRASRRVQRWLGGQLLLMLILGCSSAVTFGLLGVRYFYALAVFAGVTNFVPIIGPITSFVLACIVAAFDSWIKVIGVCIFYLVYQQVENSFLTPRIMKATVDLPAVSILIALLIGGSLAGLPGAIVAVPTAALITTVINEYLVQPDQKERTEATNIR
jgi:predicted PurR-regulated permease PerM